MISCLYRVLAIFLFTLMSISPLLANDFQTAVPENQGFSAERLQRITPVMQDFVDRGLFPGMSVTVARNGKIVFSQRYGFMDVESKKPLESDAIFRIYSMSKPITGVAAMMLLEEGKFLLDDPISKYIPAFKETKVFVKEDNGEIETVEKERPITIRHLLCHASGLGYGWGNDPVSSIYRKESAKYMDKPINLEIFANGLASVPLYFQPGTDWQYSYSIDVVGRLIEVVSGMTLEEFFQKRIFDPLEMKDTGFYITNDKLPRLTTLYRYEQSDGLVPDHSISRYQKESASFQSGGGGLLSTTSDYLRFLLMLSNQGEYKGKRLLAPQTIRLMGCNHLPDGVTLPWGKLYGHGYGLSVSVLTDLSKSPTMGSVGDFGWDGAASTFMRVDPQTGIAILLMTHRMPCDDEIQLKLKNLVYQAIE